MSDRPAYLPPLEQFLSVSSSIFFNVPRRSLARDSIYLLNHHQPRPVLSGLENLPHDGPFIVIGNHHQRDNMWIGWIGAMIIEAVYSFRPLDVPIRLVTTDSQRFKFRGQARVFPFSPWFLGRVAALWNTIRIPSDPADTAGQAAALRRVLTALKQGDPVLFFPEGDRGTASGLVEALPGTGTLLALASRYAKIIPMAFWEEGPLLRGQVHPAITLDSRDDAAVRRQVMTTIAAMLPESMRGPYGET